MKDVKEKIKSVLVDELDNGGKHYYIIANTYKFMGSSENADNKTITSIDCVEDVRGQMIQLGEEVDYDERNNTIERLPVEFNSRKRIKNLIEMFKLLATAPLESIKKDTISYYRVIHGGTVAKDDFVLAPMMTYTRLSSILDAVEDISSEQGGVVLNQDTYENGKLPLIKEVEDQKKEIEKLFIKLQYNLPDNWKDELSNRMSDSWKDELSHALNIYSVKCAAVSSFLGKLRKQQSKDSFGEQKSVNGESVVEAPEQVEFQERFETPEQVEFPERTHERF